MRFPPATRSAGFHFALAGLLIFCFALTPARAVIDLDHDGLGTIWKLKFNAANLPPGEDTDGDGKTNAEEAIAGTDPRSGGSSIAIASMTLDASGVHLSWKTVAGKQYQVQSSVGLAPADWQPEGAPVAGTDGLVQQVCATSGVTGKFYRVVARDVDTDGDGVSDWEELQVGSNPNNGHSAGLAAGDDLARLTAALQAVNTVSVTATDLASEVGLVPGTFAISRSGNLGPITVTYTVSGTATAGTDYEPLAGSVTLPMGVNTATVKVMPKADALLESPETVILTLTAAPAYTLGTPAVATVTIEDTTAATGTGLRGQYWNESSTGTGKLSDTVAAKFAGTPTVSRVDPAVNFTWATGTVQGTNSPAAGVNTTYYASRWTGEVLPQYSQVYTFYFDVNRAGRLWVNGQLLINNWPPSTISAKEYSGTIELIGGVRYAIAVEQYTTTTGGKAVLSWQSSNQPKQVIPTVRLFPDTPPQILSATDVVLLKNSGAYGYQIVASGSPTSFGAANLPPNWTFNPTTGVISGTPAQAGVWQIPVTATNAVGSGSAILTLTVVDTSGGITRDVWVGTFANLGVLPLGTPPSSTEVRTALEGPQNSTDDYGARMRGFLFAPATGAYQFWITGDDAAELWISNDDEPVNLFLRAATAAATGFRDWANASAGKSALLWLKAGQRYYVEVRHIGSGATDHVSVGWFKPGDAGTGATPTEVVPGYALSPWAAPAPSPEGALFTTTLTAQGIAVSSASGTSTLRLSPDETSAIVSFNYSNLTGPIMNKHVHDGSGRLPTTANIVFDLDEPGITRLEDGSYVWPIVPVAGLSVADLVQIIKSGTAYFNIHTPLNPNGEIKGFYRLQSGSQTFTPPAALAAPADDHTNSKAAARFLTQATYGPNTAEISSVVAKGYSGWIDSQFALAATPLLTYVEANKNITNPRYATYSSTLTADSWWKNSITAPDQLRQRVAFALSQIMVVSGDSGLEDFGDGVTDYYDTLLRGAFGNFRDLLKAVSLHPSMGVFLDMRGNDKPNLAAGLHPNENYAREILQLFSIGLYRLFPDGSTILNSKGEPVPTYDQDTIVGFAHAFTGWNYYQANSGGYLPTNFGPARYWTKPMKEVPSHHFTGTKRILNNVVLPGLPSIGGVTLDPYAAPTTAQIQNAAFQALPMQEMDATHDAIFNHPNCPPFICRQLIQRLVTSTPSRGYIYRVVQAFLNNGSGVRGDMQAVIKAILLDPEARSSTVAAQQGFGKQREPLLKLTALARAFPSPPTVTGTYSQTDNVITVNTSTPHRLAVGTTTELNITSGTPSPASNSAYTISTVPNASSFTVAAPEFVSVTYSQTGTTVTVARADRTPHYLSDRTGYDPVNRGVKVYLKNFSGATPLPNGQYLIATNVDPYKYTVESSVSVTGTVTGTGLQVVYRGRYDQTGTAISIATSTTHGLSSGDSVYIRYDAVSGTNYSKSGTFTVTVVDPTHLTVTGLDSGTRNGTVTIAPVILTFSRTGNLSIDGSTWNIGNTNGDLQQTPLYAATVFNFFEPDFRFGGALADAGLITPEFQLTSETNVITQANFIYSGIFSGDYSGTTAKIPSTNSIFSSFRKGDGSIALDFGPWMQSASSGTPWTNDENLDALIDQFDTLLTPRQLSDAARAKIKAYVSSQSNITYSNTAPTDAQKRDRLRALVHLMVTSADFVIQK